MEGLIATGIIVVFFSGLVFLFGMFVVVQQQTAVIIERFGRYHCSPLVRGLPH